MANTARIQFDQFLEEATIIRAFFLAAMRTKGIHPAGSWLRMTGPAAADYILASCPALA